MALNGTRVGVVTAWQEASFLALKPYRATRAPVFWWFAVTSVPAFVFTAMSVALRSADPQSGVAYSLPIGALIWLFFAETARDLRGHYGTRLVSADLEAIRRTTSGIVMRGYITVVLRIFVVVGLVVLAGGTWRWGILWSLAAVAVTGPAALAFSRLWFDMSALFPSAEPVFRTYMAVGLFTTGAVVPLSLFREAGTLLVFLPGTPLVQLAMLPFQTTTPTLLAVGVLATLFITAWATRRGHVMLLAIGGGG